MLLRLLLESELPLRLLAADRNTGRSRLPKLRFGPPPPYLGNVRRSGELLSSEEDACRYKTLAEAKRVNVGNNAHVLGTCEPGSCHCW